MTLSKLLFPVLFSLLLAAAAGAAEDKVLTLEGYLDMESVTGRGVPGPEISPDGSQILYTRRWVDKHKDRMETALWLMNSDGGRNRELLRGSGARWSPDGTRIAYTAKDDDGNPKIFVRWMDAEGNVTQISRAEERPNQVSWSPDSRWIAFRATVPFESDWKIKLPAKPKGAEWTEDATIIDSLHFRQDRRGRIKGYEHLFIVPADGGTPRAVTSGDWHVGARFSGTDRGARFDWTPDGKEILFDGIQGEGGEMRYFESHIHAVDVATGAIRQLTAADGFWTSPRVSPDGARVAFTGYDSENAKRTSPHAELYVMNIDGSDIKQLTSDMLGAPGQIRWAKDGKGLYFAMSAEGARNLHFADLRGRVRAVTEGIQLVSLSGVTAGRIGVGTRVTAHEPGDIVRIDLKDGSLTPLTHVNDDVLHGIELAALEEIRFESKDGTQVQGWLQLPPNFDAGKKYPLILQIHGGPHGMYNVGFNYMRQLQAADGYITVYSNPRGSIGYGEEFANAIDNVYPGRRDFEDLMASVDAAIAKGYVDTDRMYVWGCSGGGVLTSWTVSHTDRFKAAAALCPVINWISFTGQADIVAWAFKRFDGYFWDDPTKWLEHSPIMHVRNVKTPTLLMTGDLDLRTPIAQAEEFYAALKILGVPTKLVIMHQEYHGTTSKPSNFMRTFLIVKKWFEEFGGPVSEDVASAGGGGQP